MSVYGKLAGAIVENKFANVNPSGSAVPVGATKPAAPKITLSSSSGTTATFTISGLTNALAPVTSVNIYSISGPSQFSVGSASITGDTTVISVSGFIYQGLYQVSAVAINNVGKSDPATVLSFTFGTGQAPSAPLSISISNIGSNTATASWTENPANKGQVYSYRFQWGTTNPPSNTADIISSNLARNLSGLAISTLYYVRVQAYNQFGSSAWVSTSFTTAGIQFYQIYVPNTSESGPFVAGYGYGAYIKSYTCGGSPQWGYCYPRPKVSMGTITIPAGTVISVGYGVGTWGGSCTLNAGGRNASGSGYGTLSVTTLNQIQCSYSAGTFLNFYGYSGCEFYDLMIGGKPAYFDDVPFE